MQRKTQKRPVQITYKNPKGEKKETPHHLKVTLQPKRIEVQQKKYPLHHSNQKKPFTTNRDGSEDDY